MSAGARSRGVRGARPQSLFYRDLGLSPATHNSSGGGDGDTPNQVTAALWRENDVRGLDPPPPPFYTLEDRIERSPKSNANLSIQSTPKFTDKNMSFSRTIISPTGGEGGFTLPCEESKDSRASSLSRQQASGTNCWWPPLRERRSGSLEAVDGDCNGSFSGVVQDQQSGGLLALSVPGEIMRPDIHPGSTIDEGLGVEGWVTVFGFGVDETNSVMREFEKCGRIINSVSGPGSANWVHLQYLNHYDALKALQKNGILLNGALIVGVKRLDAFQCQGLTEKVKRDRLSFTGLPALTPKGSTVNADTRSTAWSHYVQPAQTGGSALRPSSVIASPAKSTFSKLVDIVFGM